MSLPRTCVACSMGEHEHHDATGTRPGLIGGTYCPCPGGCEPSPEVGLLLEIFGVNREPVDE